MIFRELRIDNGELMTGNDFVILSIAKNLKVLVEVGGKFE